MASIDSALTQTEPILCAVARRHVHTCSTSACGSVQTAGQPGNAIALVAEHIQTGLHVRRSKSGAGHTQPRCSRWYSSCRPDIVMLDSVPIRETYARPRPRCAACFSTTGALLEDEPLSALDEWLCVHMCPLSMLDAFAMQRCCAGTTWRFCARSCRLRGVSGARSQLCEASVSPGESQLHTFSSGAVLPALLQIPVCSA